MKKFLKFVVGVAAVAGSVAGVLYFWDKRKTELEEDDFDDDFDDIFEDENDDSDRDYVTLDIGEEEETEAKEDKVKEGTSSSDEPQSERQKDFHFFKKEKPDKKIMDSYSSEDDEDGFSRDQWILSHLNEKDLMKYLELEQKRAEMSQQEKETREKRIFTAFQLTVSLAAVVAVTYLLKDNPSILVSILYTIGIIAALWLWKKR